MTLNLKATARAARFEYTDGSMEVSWTVDGSLKDEELVERLRSIVAFMDAQTGGPALPQRIPGLALGMAQTQHPPMVVTEEQGMAMKRESPGSVANGWAPYAGAGLPHPAVPEGADYELIPPGEQE